MRRQKARNVPSGWPLAHAGPGQMAGEGPPRDRPTVACSPSGPAALLLPFNPQKARAGRGGARRPAGGPHCSGGLAEVPCGGGQRAAWGQASRLPTPGAALALICHVHPDLFPVRFGLHRAPAAKKRFESTDAALAFAARMKTVDSREGTRLAAAIKAPFQEDPGVDSALPSAPSSSGDKTHWPRPGRMLARHVGPRERRPRPLGLLRPTGGLQLACSVYFEEFEPTGRFPIQSGLLAFLENFEHLVMLAPNPLVGKMG